MAGTVTRRKFFAVSAAGVATGFGAGSEVGLSGVVEAQEKINCSSFVSENHPFGPLGGENTANEEFFFSTAERILNSREHSQLVNPILGKLHALANAYTGDKKFLIFSPGEDIVLPKGHFEGGAVSMVFPDYGGVSGDHWAVTASFPKTDQYGEDLVAVTFQNFTETDPNVVVDNACTDRNEYQLKKSFTIGISENMGDFVMVEEGRDPKIVLDSIQIYGNENPIGKFIQGCGPVDFWNVLSSENLLGSTNNVARIARPVLSWTNQPNDAIIDENGDVAVWAWATEEQNGGSIVNANGSDRNAYEIARGINTIVKVNTSQGI